MFKELIKFMKYDKLIAEDDPEPAQPQQQQQMHQINNEVEVLSQYDF